MEEFSVGVFLAIFEEMFGFWTFWFLIALAVVSIVFFIYLLVAKKRTKSEHFFWAKWVSLFAAVASVFIIMWMTSSWFNDIGGAIDVFILLAVAILSAIAAGVLAFITQSFLTTDKAIS